MTKHACDFDIWKHWNKKNVILTKQDNEFSVTTKQGQNCYIFI